MTDYDSIWRTQDEIRTVVNAVLGECIWNLSYSERRMAIELELTVTLDDDAIDELCSQFSETADYLISFLNFTATKLRNNSETDK